jgi:hypothetical protein
MTGPPAPAGGPSTGGKVGAGQIQRRFVIESRCCPWLRNNSPAIRPGISRDTPGRGERTVSRRPAAEWEKPEH